MLCASALLYPSGTANLPEYELKVEIPLDSYGMQA